MTYCENIRKLHLTPTQPGHKGEFMMIVERRQKLPHENTGYRIERRQHRRQTGTRINRDFAFQCWQPEPDIKKVKKHPALAIFLVAEIAVIAAVFAGWLS